MDPPSKFKYAFEPPAVIIAAPANALTKAPILPKAMAVAAPVVRISVGYRWAHKANMAHCKAVTNKP